MPTLITGDTVVIDNFSTLKASGTPQAIEIAGHNCFTKVCAKGLGIHAGDG